MNDRSRLVAIPLLGIFLAVSSAPADAQVAAQRWTTSGTELEATADSLPVAETRPIPRSEIKSGLALSGRGTPFIIAPRVDGIPGGLATDAVTIEAWVSIDMPTQWGGVVGAIQDNAEAETGMILGYGFEKPYFGIASTGVDDADGKLTYMESSKPYEIGKWHHLVGTYDGTTMRLYLDGEPVAESRDQSGPVRFRGDEPLVIGGYLDRNEDHGLDGRLLEVSILPEAISAAEVRRRFARHADLAALPPEIDTTLAWMVEPFLVWPTTNAMSVVAETIAPSGMEVRVRDESGDFQRSWRHDQAARIHEFRIDGLDANTKYFYEVVADAGESTLSGGVKTFRTAADRGDPFTFVAIGDTQSQPAVVKRIADLAFETRPSLLVHAGDLVTTGGDKGHWTNHFFPNMRPLIERVAIMPVLGNHEQDAKLYYDYMSLPDPERWYSFSYGDADFFMIDGNRSLADRSAQLEWLEGALAESDAEWKFAVLHQPPWTSDSNDYGDTYKTSSKRGDPNARNITSLLEKHGVDICFSGHVHDYERTFPMVGEDVVPWDEGGVIYVTTAGGGGHLEDFDPANTTFGHRKARRHHFVYGGIHDGILEFQAMDEDGRLFDVLTLDKRDGRRSVARAAREGVEIAPRTPTWRDAPADGR
ncbi:MAG: metallophosphoesterase [Phycisphaerales bacterium]|nr:metallophosphoesterase [Phycisphaerales bacterium]